MRFIVLLQDESCRQKYGIKCTVNRDIEYVKNYQITVIKQIREVLNNGLIEAKEYLDILKSGNSIIIWLTVNEIEGFRNLGFSVIPDCYIELEKDLFIIE